MATKNVRLIDANALLEEICKKCPENYCKPDATDTVSGCLIYDVIASAPTIDAQSVKRGRWIDIGHNAWLKCSNCGKRIRYRNGIKNEITVTDGRFNHTHEASQNGYYNFCPNCGARMEIDEDGTRD